ncbi:hypothetical protein XPA_010529 [Xanthoria parietina]
MSSSSKKLFTQVLSGSEQAPDRSSSSTVQSNNATREDRPVPEDVVPAESDSELEEGEIREETMSQGDVMEVTRDDLPLPPPLSSGMGRPQFQDDAKRLKVLEEAQVAAPIGWQTPNGPRTADNDLDDTATIVSPEVLSRRQPLSPCIFGFIHGTEEPSLAPIDHERDPYVESSLQWFTTDSGFQVDPAILWLNWYPFDDWYEQSTSAVKAIPAIENVRADRRSRYLTVIECLVREPSVFRNFANPRTWWRLPLEPWIQVGKARNGRDVMTFIFHAQSGVKPSLEWLKQLVDEAEGDHGI